MSDRGSGSGGPHRSDRLAKGKAVIYAWDSSPDTDDEYDAMEDVRIRADASIARNLQAELDAEAAGLASGVARPSSLLPKYQPKRGGDLGWGKLL